MKFFPEFGSKSHRANYSKMQRTSQVLMLSKAIILNILFSIALGNKNQVSSRSEAFSILSNPKLKSVSIIEGEDSSRQSFVYDGIVKIEIKNDTDYVGLFNNVFERVWWYCVPSRFHQPSENSPATWVRTDSIGSVNKCIRRCARDQKCSTAQDFPNIFNSPLVRCATNTCGAYASLVDAIRLSDNASVQVGFYFVPTPRPSPVSASPTPTMISQSVTPTPSPSNYRFPAASSIVSQSPTPSPIRKPEDFELDPKDKDPQENGRAVGAILETEVESLLDEENGTTGADVSVVLKISQNKGNTSPDEDIQEDEDGLSVVTVSRPLRYCLPNRNCAVRVIITSEITLRKFLIQKAVARLREAPQFFDVFKNTRKSYKIIRKPFNVNVVVVRFNDNYLVGFI